MPPANSSSVPFQTRPPAWAPPRASPGGDVPTAEEPRSQWAVASETGFPFTVMERSSFSTIATTGFGSGA